MKAGDLSFATLAIGAGNKVAASAARSFATAAAPDFNPLYIAGAGGFGKTHILGAIERAYGGRCPAAPIVDLSGDELVMGYSAAIRGGEALEYQLKLRRAQLLLVDDVQCLASYPASQVMLLQAASAVIAAGGRVAFAGDRPPHELEGFMPGLLAILESGAVVDLEPPDIEQKLEVLRSMVSASGVGRVPDEVLQFIARQLGSNMRLLRGSFNRLAAYALADRRAIDQDYALAVLREVLRGHRRRISIDEIKGRVSRHFQIRESEMVSARRSRDVARPRQVAMYLSKQLTPRSLPEIGRMFGGRDHTTVIHAIRQIEKLRGTDDQLDADVRRIERELLH